MTDEMDEIWALYADDGAQALDAMETALMSLGPDASGPDRDGHIAALFRAVHTFKGNSRVLGLSVVESRAHLAEDLIGLVRDRGAPWDAEVLDILLLASDVLRGMLEETASTRADVAPDGSNGLMARLAEKIAACEAALDGEPVDDPAPVIAPPAADPVAAGPDSTELDAVAPADPTRALEAPADVAPAADVAEPTAAADTAAAPAAPQPSTAPPPARRLADDPTYRGIFRGMVAEARTKLESALNGLQSGDQTAAAQSKREADGLLHAARQMGLDDWVDALAHFAAQAADGGAEGLAALLLRMDDLDARLDPQPDATAPMGTDFFDAIRAPLEVISRLGTGFSCGEAPDPQELLTNTTLLRDAALASGFVRVAESADHLARASDATLFRDAELLLYEELGAVEAVMPEAARASGISPRDLVQSWCFDHVFDTLSALEAVIDRLKRGTSLDADYIVLGRLMRLVYHACMKAGIETAAQLSMSLIDLFSRSHAAGVVPDAILTHIARGFIDTIELVFDALAQGERPDTASLEKLFEEASNVCFVAGGVMTATAVERRLGLPREFHRVLSPESVRAAAEAIDADYGFCILRADINTDERLAEAFIEWLASGQHRPITNVTVFMGTDTLFDFLIATRDTQARIAESLAMLDPTGQKLQLQRMLTIAAEQEADGHPDDVDAVAAAQAQPGISAAMVEQIGEIAASQSMVSHMLKELTEADLAEAADAILRSAGSDVKRARADLRAMLGQFTARLQEVAQLDSQLVTQLAELQEATVAIRARPVESMLRPLETYIQAHAQRQGRTLALSHSGGDLSVDLTLLDQVRRMLRSLVLERLQATGQAAPSAIHMAFHRDEERMAVIVEDDGAHLGASAAIDAIEAELFTSGGDLRRVNLPGRGMRFHFTLPLAMVVLEGMVVGVDGVRYVMPVEAIRMILQPEEERRIRVSAADNHELLRIAENEYVPIRPLGLQARDGGRNVFVVLGVERQSIAIPVDELVGQQLVLLRPLRGVLRHVQNMTGIALLAGGDVGMVVSANQLCAARAEGMGRDVPYVM